jgi:uncharacterized glyoxalase superfamily protein PhnB
MSVTAAAATQMRTISPYFIVNDVVQSAEYYRDRLGFDFRRFWGDPPCFVMVHRDGVQIMLKQLERPGQSRPNRTVDADAPWDAYIYVRDVEALYQELKARGAKIIRLPERTFYEMTEIEVEECNGYVLCFGQDTSRPK